MLVKTLNQNFVVRLQNIQNHQIQDSFFRPKQFRVPIENGKIDAGIAATPLENIKLIEKPLYYEPFVGYIPEIHPLSKLKTITPLDIENNDILVLEDFSTKSLESHYFVVFPDF